MTFHDFFTFILPEFDVIQILFGGLMIFLVSVTIILLSFKANKRNWAKKWQGSSLDDAADHLDVEHGSINEISAAVATSAEKIADIMPGILLILGLLGTFLGLGIALNKASDILIDANSAGMDTAMSNLMGMMEGLGTKFKTSTWGIMAFLLLKSWSAALRYDDKRLRWCAQQMKLQFEKSREHKRTEHERTQQQYLAALQGLNDRIKQESEATQKSLSQLSSGIEPLLQTLIEQGSSALQQGKVQDTHLVRLTDVLHTTQQQYVEGLQEVSGSIRQESETTRQALHSFHDETTKLLTAIAAHEDEALKQQAIQHAQQVESNTLLVATQQHLLTSAEQGQLQLAELAKTRKLLQHFIETNSSNFAAIKDSVDKMSVSAQDMGSSAGELQQVIGDFRSGISDMLSAVKTDLGSTIVQMGESFSHNMEVISGSMASATDGISSAVTDLSQNVGSTMSDVRVSIDQSMTTQRAAQKEFIITSETLNEKVIAMTKLVDDLREQIVSGLTAVSSSNRQVASLNNRYANITESGEKSADAIESLVNQLQIMQLQSPLQPAMDIIHAGISQLVRSIESLRDDIPGRLDASVALSTLDGRFITALEELGTIRETLTLSEQDQAVRRIAQSLEPLVATIERLDQTLITMNTVSDVV